MRKYQKDSTPPQISLGFSSNKTGFTLIELLVVIAVLGVLATVLIVIINPLGQMAKTRDSVRKSDLRQIANALNNSLVLNGSYPVPPPGGDCWEGQPCWSLSGLSLTGEIKSLPTDPQGGNTSNCSLWSDRTDVCHVYRYCTPDNGKTFILAVNLESGPTKTSIETDPGCEQLSGSHIYIIHSN